MRERVDDVIVDPRLRSKKGFMGGDHGRCGGEVEGKIDVDCKRKRWLNGQ